VLNPTTTLEVRAPSPAELAARVRRAEQEATLRYRITVELTAENRWRTPQLRAWVVGQRTHHRERACTGERSPPGTGQPRSARLSAQGGIGRRPGPGPSRRAFPPPGPSANATAAANASPPTRQAGACDRSRVNPGIHCRPA
jgi:hypothetical protein